MTPAVPALMAGGRAGVRSQGGGITLPPPFGGGYGMPGAYVFDPQSARRIPAVGRAIQLMAGMAKQMPLQGFRGAEHLVPTPRLLAKPDLLRGGPEYIQLSVEDYLLSGNTISLVTARGVDGWPLAVTWLPITWCFVEWLPPSPIPRYFYLSQELPFEDVVHIRRGADRYYPVRGVGVVEEHLSSLDRMAMEEEYERGALTDGAVPSVAVIAPQSTITQEIADQAKSSWLEKFGGPVREPVILPNGTVVQPLAWSPTDTQLAEARRLSLTDVANMFNIDGYWFGAPVSGLTYKTAGPQYQSFLRTSLEPVIADFEAGWSDAWVPRGTAVRFHRAQLLREDLPTSATAAVALKNAGIVTLPESRVMVGLPPDAEGAIGTGSDMSGNNPTPNDVSDPSETEGE